MKKLKLLITFFVLASLKCISQDSLEVLNYYNARYQKTEGIYREMCPGCDSPFRENCLKGIKLAMEDVEKGILRTGSFGYPAPKMFKEERVIKVIAFEKILQDEYGVTHQHYGCDIGKYECYNHFMHEKIIEKYGDSLYHKVWKIVDSLWGNDLIDLPVRFPGGDSTLNKFIYCNLHLAADNNSKNGTNKMAEVTLDINKKGKIVSYSINKDNTDNHPARNLDSPEYEKEISRLIDLMPDWLPQRENQKFIPSKKTIYIYFDERRKEDLKCN
jgi:hypothetical protein